VLVIDQAAVCFESGVAGLLAQSVLVELLGGGRVRIIPGRVIAPAAILDAFVDPTTPPQRVTLGALRLRNAKGSRSHGLPGRMWPFEAVAGDLEVSELVHIVGELEDGADLGAVCVAAGPVSGN
jgi:hypothetical protein